MKGLLLNITGDGKGKSTSAFGMVIRSLGYGRKVRVLQFVKGDFPTGEKAFFGELRHPSLVFEQTGAGFTWNKSGDHAGAACAGWEKVLPVLSGQIPCDLLVLDELNVALHEGLLPLNEVLEALKNRTDELDVVITGRYAPQELLELSDLVSVIENRKHPFDSGKIAKKGIDF